MILSPMILSHPLTTPFSSRSLRPLLSRNVRKEGRDKIMEDKIMTSWNANLAELSAALSEQSALRSLRKQAEHGGQEK